MKNRLKKGFTLVELLVTIVLLGVVGAIVIYNMTSVTSNSKESEYDRFIATIKSAAKVYSSNNPEAFDSLYSNRSFVYFTVKDLITIGFTSPLSNIKISSSFIVFNASIIYLSLNENKYFVQKSNK